MKSRNSPLGSSGSGVHFDQHGQSHVMGSTDPMNHLGLDNSGAGSQSDSSHHGPVYNMFSGNHNQNVGNLSNKPGHSQPEYNMPILAGKKGVPLHPGSGSNSSNTVGSLAQSVQPGNSIKGAGKKGV